MKEINEKLVSYASIIDEATLNQAIETSKMPFIFGRVTLMPDAHFGKGSTIGSVIPTTDAIMPAAVGVDIGCGMQAVRLPLEGSELKYQDLIDWRDLVQKLVPMGRGQNQLLTDRTLAVAERLRKDYEFYRSDPAEFHPNWDLQLGSLGSGNHFIEVDEDEEGLIWLTLHTGSRGVGLKMANHHIAIAKDRCKLWYVELPNEDLAFLPKGTKEIEDYIWDLVWAQEYARENRNEIMARLLGAVSKIWGISGYEELIDCHHNYMETENHWGKNVWITRKGAIRARTGDLALIPGSMGTPSYIVRGKGNRAAFESAPHGAGRTGSRSQAFKNFSFEQAQAAMAGVIWGQNPKLVDESPLAYKDIRQVMEDAADLIEPIHTLRPLLNIKGL